MNRFSKFTFRVAFVFGTHDVFVECGRAFKLQDRKAVLNLANQQLPANRQHLSIQAVDWLANKVTADWSTLFSGGRYVGGMYKKLSGDKRSLKSNNFLRTEHAALRLLKQTVKGYLKAADRCKNNVSDHIPDEEHFLQRVRAVCKKQQWLEEIVSCLTVNNEIFEKQYVAESRDFEKHCKILGVTAHDSRYDIKKAYRRLALKWHPDKHSSKTPDEQKVAGEEFKKINAAFQALCDSNYFS